MTDSISKRESALIPRWETSSHTPLRASAAMVWDAFLLQQPKVAVGFSRKERSDRES